MRDVLPERIEALQAGEVPIYEPGLDEVLERCRERISFTLDVGEAVGGADFLYVAVGTPPTYSGDADLSAVWTVVDEIPEGVTGRPLLVMKSTVPVGTGERVLARLVARGLENVGYVSNPEFTAEGSAIADFMHPDRVVVGAFDPADAERVVELHEGIETEVLRMDVASAELVKLASNAFLSTRISFINEIANVCELVGADVVEVAARYRARPPARAALPPRRDRLRRLAASRRTSRALKQLAGNSGYPFLLLQAVMGGERAPEAAGRAEAPAAAREPARAHRRAPRARVQAEHRRPARGAEPHHRATGCSPRARRCGRGIPLRGRTTSRASRSATRCSKRCAAPTPR